MSFGRLLTLIAALVGLVVGAVLMARGVDWAPAALIASFAVAVFAAPRMFGDGAGSIWGDSSPVSGGDGSGGG